MRYGNTIHDTTYDMNNSRSPLIPTPICENGEMGTLHASPCSEGPSRQKIGRTFRPIPAYHKHDPQHRASPARSAPDGASAALKSVRPQAVFGSPKGRRSILPNCPCRTASRADRRLGQQLRPHLTFAGDRQGTPEAVAQGRGGIDPQQVVRRGQHVLGRDRRLGHVSRDAIRLADHAPRGESAAGEDGRVGTRPVVAPTALDVGQLWRPPVFADAQHGRLGEQAPRFQVADQSGVGRIEGGTEFVLHARIVLVVRVPRAVRQTVLVPEDADKSAARLDQPASDRGCPGRSTSCRSSPRTGHRLCGGCRAPRASGAMSRASRPCPDSGQSSWPPGRHRAGAGRGPVAPASERRRSSRSRVMYRVSREFRAEEISEAALRLDAAVGIAELLNDASVLLGEGFGALTTELSPDRVIGRPKETAIGASPVRLIGAWGACWRRPHGRSDVGVAPAAWPAASPVPPPRSPPPNR